MQYERVKEPHVEDLLREYLPVLVFLGMATALGAVLILAAVILGPTNPDPEKLSAYECGFNEWRKGALEWE